MTPVGVSNQPKKCTGQYDRSFQIFFMDTVMMNEYCQFTKLVTLDEAHTLCLAQQFQGIVELY